MGETLSEEEVGRMMTQADQVLGVGASALNKNFLFLYIFLHFFGYGFDNI